MATNIEMNLYNGSDYTVLYPKTAASNLDGTLSNTQIPNLDASKITSGTLSTSRIPNLSATKITSGTLPVSRGGTGNTSLSGLASDLSSYLDTGSNNPNVSNATGTLPISHGGTGSTTASSAIYGLTNGLTARTASQVNSYASSTYLPCYYSTTGYKMPISALLTYIQNNASTNSDSSGIEITKYINSPTSLTFSHNILIIGFFEEDGLYGFKQKNSSDFNYLREGRVSRTSTGFTISGKSITNLSNVYIKTGTSIIFY